MAFLLLTHIARFISWEDSVRAHPAYIKAALAASQVCSYLRPVPFLCGLQILIAVHDNPSLATPETAAR